MCEWAFLFSFFRQTEERKGKSPLIYSRMAMQKSRGPPALLSLKKSEKQGTSQRLPFMTKLFQPFYRVIWLRLHGKMADFRLQNG